MSFNRIIDGTAAGERYLVVNAVKKGSYRVCATLCEAEQFIRDLPEPLQGESEVHIITGSGGMRPPYV